MLHPDPALVMAMNAEIGSRLNIALSHLIRDGLGRDWPQDLVTPPPCAYALQGLMRAAAVAGDIAKIEQLHTEYGAVLRDSDLTQRCRIIAYAAPDLSPQEQTLLQFGFNDDIGLTAQLTAPDPADTQAAITEITALKPLLATHLPLWWQELQALLDTIILATTTDTGQSFAGASAFDVWGAILINPAYRRDRLHLALTMVHESSHLKLFHAYLDDDIVLNPPDQTFSSPLRRTPRPMNGLYHAAFVLARMALFIADIGRAKAGERMFGPGADRALKGELARAITSFDSAQAIIAAQGQLTAKGRQMMAEAAFGIDQCRVLAWPV